MERRKRIGIAVFKGEKRRKRKKSGGENVEGKGVARDEGKNRRKSRRRMEKWPGWRKRKRSVVVVRKRKEG